MTFPRFLACEHARRPAPNVTGVKFGCRHFDPCSRLRRDVGGLHVSLQATAHGLSGE